MVAQITPPRRVPAQSSPPTSSVRVRRHEIPTHLNVEDRAFFGLSVRQVLYLVSGLAGSYGLWNQWEALPLGLRTALAGACLLVALALALVRPLGRGLEEWSFVALHYAAVPKARSWRPQEPDAWRPAAAGRAWAELAPPTAWGTGSATHQEPAQRRQEEPPC
jgi:hypothetical protein